MSSSCSRPLSSNTEIDQPLIKNRALGEAFEDETQQGKFHWYGTMSDGITLAPSSPARECHSLKFDMSLKERPSVDEMVHEALVHSDPTGATTFPQGVRLTENLLSRPGKEKSVIPQFFGFAWQWANSVAIWVILSLAFTLDGLMVPIHQYLMTPRPGSLLGEDKSKFETIPPLSLLVVANGLALLIYLPRIAYKFCSCLTRNTVLDQVEPVLEVPSYGVRVTVARSDMGIMSRAKDSFIQTLKGTVTNSNWYTYSTIVLFFNCLLLISLSLTSPVIVNAMMLMTAFIVCVASTQMEWSLRIDAFIHCCATAIGGLLVVMGMTTITDPEAFTLRFTFDPVAIINNATLMDVVGVFFAFWESALYAMFMLFVGNLTKADVKPPRHGIRGASTQSCENLFIMQCLCIVGVLTLPSLLLEDWSHWLKMNTTQYLAVLVLAVMVFMAGSILRLVALSRCREGTPAVSAFLPLSLIPQVFVSMVILPNSIPNNMWQLVGMFVIQTSCILFIVQSDLRQFRNELIEAHGKSTVKLLSHKRTGQRASSATSSA